MDTPDTPEPGQELDDGVELISVGDALGNAVRILRNAEMESNLALMERLEGLADSWISLAQTIAAL